MLLKLFYFIGLLICNSDGVLCHEHDEAEVKETPVQPELEPGELEIESAIQKVENIALAAEKSSKVGIIPREDTEAIYDYMVESIDDIAEAIKKSDNVYKFLKAKGLLRIVSNNLAIPNSKLRAKLLLLLKDFFDSAPTTINAVIPINIVDRLLDIFEYDDNLALKAHALDILCKWLPDNPRIQARVIKVRGLASFYNPMNKLDIGVIKTMMELFNTILNEHLDARSEKAQVTKLDSEKQLAYQRIGLIERMSTSYVCDGLLNIFEMLLSYNRSESDMIKTVFDLIKLVQPFCKDIYKRRPKAFELFEVLLKHVKNEDRYEYLVKHGLNITDVVVVIQKYLDDLKYSSTVKYSVKEEF